MVIGMYVFRFSGDLQKFSGRANTPVSDHGVIFITSCARQPDRHSYIILSYIDNMLQISKYKIRIIILISN